MSAPQQSHLRTAFAGLIGNVLEWYDFAVYGYFADDIGARFFPKTDPTAQQLLAFAVLALGFVARPFGSIVLGRIGDRYGRRALMALSIGLMGGSTVALGLLPTYETVGVFAPILLVLARLVQGFSLGGEFTGSMVYTTELAAQSHRGLVSSSTAAGTTIGFLLGSGTAYLVARSLSSADAAAWGWRIPFLASVVLTAAGYALRHHLVESAEGEAAASARPPLWPSLRADWRPIVQTFGIVAMTNAAYYLTFTFAIDRRKSGPSGKDFLLVNTAVLAFELLAKAFGGWLSDKVGRRRLMVVLTVAMLACVYFSLDLMLTGSALRFALGQLLLALPIGMALGLQGAMVVEIFPLRTRVTSMSFAYSITLALAGGLAPLISTYLVDRLHHPTWPAFYIMIYGVIGLALLIPMRETNHRTLSD